MIFGFLSVSLIFWINGVKKKQEFNTQREEIKRDGE
jgi:hypothetical protein